MRLSRLFVLTTLACVACGARTTLDGPNAGGGGGDHTGGGGAAPQGGDGGVGAGPVGGSGGSGGSGGGTVTTIISTSPDSFFEGETDVKAAPNGFVVAAWISVDNNAGSSFISYAFSTDFGDTWGSPIRAENPPLSNASDPVLTVDESGTFYLTWVAYDIVGGGQPGNMTVLVARAPAGVPEFDPAIAAVAGTPNDLRDKPWIAHTPEGTIMVTFAEANGTGFDAVAVRSFDGANWERNTIMHDGAFNIFRNLIYPCTDPIDGGRLHAVWVALDQGLNASIETAFSDDLGANWSAPIPVSDPGELVAFTDPTCVVRGNEVLVSYGLTEDPAGEGDTPILFATQMKRSVDGGLSFGSAVNVQETSMAMLPTLSRDLSGTIGLTYYVGDFFGDTNGSFRITTSPNADSGFAPTSVVANPVVFTPIRADIDWLGDYSGIAALDGHFYMTFVDNSSGISHVAFARR
ncbi:MAG: sialidase family protein [Polyangiaceae bacterium]